MLAVAYLTYHLTPGADNFLTSPPLYDKFIIVVMMANNNTRKEMQTVKIFFMPVKNVINITIQKREKSSGFKLFNEIPIKRCKGKVS